LAAVPEGNFRIAVADFGRLSGYPEPLVAGYSADWIRDLFRQQGAWANFPPKRNRKDQICFSP
jgi:hypothetical protein